MKVIGFILYFLINPFDCFLRVKTQNKNKIKERDKDKENKINKVLFSFLVFLISAVLSALIIIIYILLTKNNIIEEVIEA